MNSAAIQDEIALSHSLMLLDREYGLRHLFVRGTRLLQETGGDPGRARAAVRENILPLSLIGIGLAWLTVAVRSEHADGSALLRGFAHLQDIARDLGVLRTGDRPASSDPARN